MERDPGERAEAYLDGALSPEETLAFERDLAERPEAGRALAGALALRELLRAMPPLAPPPGLEERVAALLLSSLEPPRQETRARSSPGAIRSALAGAIWAVRGPAGALGGAAPAAAGIAQVRWTLGPLARGGAARSPARAPRPLWKRALGVGA
jgi:anti-sigma factor RsiW